jgi:hypothetical protein
MRTAPAPTPGPFGLECGLTSASAAQPRADGPIEVRFTLVNRSDRTVYVLRWSTPLEGIYGDILTVERAGEAIAYRGPLVKRGDPGRGDYLDLAPGKSLDATIDLGPAYDFSRSGRYTARFSRGLADVATDPAALPRPRDAHQPVPLACPVLTLEVVP